MKQNITSHFTVINGVSIHYRLAGEGQIIFLLHPSPRNSKMMEPLINLLSSHYKVIALDTPGYGFSESLLTVIEDINSYTNFLNNFFSIFSQKGYCIYGTATGAQMAIAFSLQFPHKIKHLFLDNIAHFEDEEREIILEKYFINLTPKEDGSHLKILWNHLEKSSLFFPWYDEDEKNRISNTPPAVAILQNITNDYLQAGVNYADAYKAAFNHERKEKVQSLNVSTTVFKWLGSPLLKFMNRVTNSELPKNIKVVETPISITERYSVMKKDFLEKLS